MRLTLETLELRDNPAVAFTPRVPIELFQHLAADVRVLTESATKPSPAAVQSLVMTSWSAFSDGVVTPAELMQIVQAAKVVITEANVSQSAVVAVIGDVQAIHMTLGSHR